MNLLNEKILCYLTSDARRAIHEMKTVGMDEDLALSVLEQLWPESAIYSISDEEGPVCE